MKKIYLKVREEDRLKIRGIPLKLIPDETDDCFEFRNKEFENILLKIHLKAEQETANRIKAMMWFHQDYNIKHYSVSFHPSNIIQSENGSRFFSIKREIEYHPPKRNGHRRNHAPSELYKDIAEQVAQQDIQKNSHVQTPFGKEYGLEKQLGLI